MPLVVTYHPRFHDLGKVTRKYFIYLYIGEQVKLIFTVDPLGLFRSTFSPRTHSVWANVHLLLGKKRPSWCGKVGAKVNINETDTFQSFITLWVCKVNKQFRCDSKCINYSLSCWVWFTVVWVNWWQFCLWWNNHKCSQRVILEVVTATQNYFHQHFLGEDHRELLINCIITLITLITLIGKTDSLVPTNFFWLYKLKTVAPLGLNIHKPVRCCYFIFHCTISNV